MAYHICYNVYVFIGKYSFNAVVFEAAASKDICSMKGRSLWL